MDIFEAVRSVLAVRTYEDRPVPEDLTRRIVEAGRLTASATNRQPWHFVVVTERERVRSLGEAVKSGRYIAEAPLAIAVAVERESRFAVSDASRAIQSMILTAWDAGVGSNWTGFLAIEGVRSILAIPDAYDILAVLPFGYPAQPVGAGKKNRKPLAEVASRERFGQRFA
ncbi:MAG: nitroreductase family protein [Actinomycetota bacterium]|nr:nitroreductase family protein [Actinomycetota bacterium]